MSIVYFLLVLYAKDRVIKQNDPIYLGLVILDILMMVIGYINSLKWLLRV